MTAWADYSYYISEYLAGRAPTVSEADFRSYAVSATAIAKLYTGERIADDSVPDEAKYAVCAIMEAVAENESARLHGGVTAEKTGDLSVTYESAPAREAAFSQTVAGIVRQWLTPWMYLGVRSC
jgi:hypothetical protein